MTDENKNAVQLPCEVVQDLLPLYCDEVVSGKTAEMVAAHLEDCGECRREYELIRTSLPVAERRSTAGKFADMMRRIRIRRILTIAAVVVLTCAVLAGGFWGLTQVPVRAVGPGCISIERSYLYEDEEGTRLFVWYRVPMWDSPTFQNMSIEKTEDAGVWALKCEYKAAILSRQIDDEKAWDAVWDLSVDAAIDEVKSITFEGETIWDAEKAQKVPDYVAFNREFNSMSGPFTGMTIDADKNLIGFDSYEDQYYIYWDMDGNLIYEGDGTDADKVMDFDVPSPLPDDPPDPDE